MRKILNVIQTRFNDKVMFIWSDKKTSLNDDFDKLLRKTKIIFELSTPDTKEQNNHVEQKDEIFIIKTRALQIDVDLSHYL